MTPKAYYARPISIDNTPQEKRDHDLIYALGFEPYPIGDEKATLGWWSKLPRERLREGNAP